MYKMQGSGLQNGDELDRVQYAAEMIEVKYKPKSEFNEYKIRIIIL